MDTVILPLIRRVMPALIADQVIYGKPGPDSSVDILDFIKLSMTKPHFGYFLRVYNRRRIHSIRYLVSLGYYYAGCNGFEELQLARLWCNNNLPLGSYVNNGRHFCFANQRDYLEFMITCK